MREIPQQEGRKTPRDVRGTFELGCPEPPLDAAEPKISIAGNFRRVGA